MVYIHSTLIFLFLPFPVPHILSVPFVLFSVCCFVAGNGHSFSQPVLHLLFAGHRLVLFKTGAASMTTAPGKLAYIRLGAVESWDKITPYSGGQTSSVTPDRLHLKTLTCCLSWGHVAQDSGRTVKRESTFQEVRDSLRRRSTINDVQYCLSEPGIGLWMCLCNWQRCREAVCACHGNVCVFNEISCQYLFYSFFLSICHWFSFLSLPTQNPPLFALIFSTFFVMWNRV